MLEYDRLLGCWLDEDGIYDGIVEVNVDTGEATKCPPPKEILEEEQEAKFPIEYQEQQAVLVQNKIVELKQQLKLAEEEQRAIHEGLLKGMQQNGIEQVQFDNMIITRKHETTQHRLDVEKLKKEMPELVEKYSKDISIGEHIEIRIKK